MRKSRFSWVVAGAPLVTLALGFGWTWDSLNTIKLSCLGLVAFFALVQIVSAAQNSARVLSQSVIIISIFFFLALLIPIIFSDSPFAQQIYGATGRNLGFLHYFFLTIIFASVGISKFDDLVPRLFKALMFAGIFEAAYGLIQYSKLDPMPWKNPQGWIFGTLGNPNFLSSFLALSTIATFYYVVNASRFFTRAMYLLFAIFQSIVIFLSSSAQGVFLLVFGTLALILVFTFNRSKILGVLSTIFSAFLVIIASLGIFQSGPLARYLYQDSVSFRGDYWRSGINMFRSNWNHGVGLDSFGDFYRIYRDSKAINRRGLDVVSNNAHNILIELASTGGALLLVAYISLIGLVLYSIAKKIKSDHRITFEYQILVILWLAFNIQTLISINVSGLAIWGWIFSGLLVANVPIYDSAGTRFNKVHGKKRSKVKIAWLSSFVFTAVLIFPLIYREVLLSSAFAKNEIPQISKVISTFPRDADLIASVAVAYEKQGLYSNALKLAKIGVSENPNSFRCWELILQSPLEKTVEKNKAKQAIRRLEPNYDFSLG